MPSKPELDLWLEMPEQRGGMLFRQQEQDWERLVKESPQQREQRLASQTILNRTHQASGDLGLCGYYQLCVFYASGTYKHMYHNQIAMMYAGTAVMYVCVVSQFESGTQKSIATACCLGQDFIFLTLDVVISSLQYNVECDQTMGAAGTTACRQSFLNKHNINSYLTCS